MSAALDSSGYPSSVAALLHDGNRPSISKLCTDVASLRNALQHYRGSFVKTNEILDALYKGFFKREHWAALTKEGRWVVLNGAGNAAAVEKQLPDKPTDRDTCKMLRSFSSIMKDQVRSDVPGPTKVYESRHSPKVLKNLLARIVLRYPESEWAHAREQVFSDLVLLDLYPAEAGRLYRELELCLRDDYYEAAHELPEPVPLLTFVVHHEAGNDPRQVAAETFEQYLKARADRSPHNHFYAHRDPEEENLHAALLHHGYGHGNAHTALALGHYYHRLTTSGPLSRLTPRQAARYGQAGSGAAWV